MAWTAKSERFVGVQQGPTPEKVGPGVYIAHGSYEADASYAPFGSTTGSRADTKLKASTQISPPPGAYDPKLPGSYDSGLPRKEVPFCSSEPRSRSQAKSRDPGPGAYDLGKQLPSPLACRTMGEPVQDRKSVFRSTSAPSIPRAHQCCGYEETGDGRLVRQTPALVILSGRPADSAGPGHYGAPERPVRPSGGKFLAADARPGLKSHETPGPGHYIARKESSRAVASSFVSQADRSSLPASKLKALSQLPGPGAYTHSRSQPNLREVHAELQYFGSTTERFGSGGGDGRPGPGAYAEPVRHLRIQPKPFGSSSRRVSETKRGEQPGPGAYDPSLFDGKTSGPTGSVSILGAMGGMAFGSMAKKGGIGDGKGGNVPGPGAYEQTDPQVTTDFGLKGGERPLQQRRRPQMPSSVFASSTAKDQVIKDAVKGSNKHPPPGAYNPVLAQDTTAVVRMQHKDEGFLGAAPRFTYGVGGGPGPGRYDPMDTAQHGGKRVGSHNRTIIEGAPRSGVPKGLGFVSQDVRFKVQKALRNTPGPGSYETDPSWITKTHNVYFGDVA